MLIYKIRSLITLHDQQYCQYQQIFLPQSDTEKIKKSGSQTILHLSVITNYTRSIILLVFITLYTDRVLLIVRPIYRYKNVLIPRFIFYTYISHYNVYNCHLNN